MHVKVVLVDVNPQVVKAWQQTFEENPEVEIAHGSMLEQHVSAWVTPTNSQGRMDGGLDGVIKKFLGGKIEKRVQAAIKDEWKGKLPVGCATCVATDEPLPRFLISTPTMVGSSDDISATMNVVLAAAAAFQAVHMQNERLPGSIRSVALPGLGAQTGRVPVEICADLMWTAYDLFREHAFTDFAAMRKALEDQLGDLGPTSTDAKKKIHVDSKVAPKPKELPPEDDEDDASSDEDFDDFDDEDDDD